MRKFLFIIIMTIISMVGLLANPALTQKRVPTFDEAVAVIKKYEGMHSPKHWPLIGYGHKVLSGEKYKRGVQLSEKEADRLLRSDLQKLCARYRNFGKDSLLLAVLAYNIGIGNVGKSSIITKLKTGNRNIKDTYVAHCRYRGKVNSQIQRRRHEEFELLYVN